MDRLDHSTRTLGEDDASGTSEQTPALMPPLEGAESIELILGALVAYRAHSNYQGASRLDPQGLAQGRVATVGQQGAELDQGAVRFHQDLLLAHAVIGQHNEAFRHVPQGCVLGQIRGVPVLHRPLPVLCQRFASDSDFLAFFHGLLPVAGETIAQRSGRVNQRCDSPAQVRRQVRVLKGGQVAGLGSSPGAGTDSRECGERRVR